MEVDQTFVNEEELDYWCKEYPELERDEVAAILECVEIEQIKCSHVVEVRIRNSCNGNFKNSQPFFLDDIEE